MKHVFTGRRYTRAESCAPKVGSDRSRILVTLFLSRLYDSRYLLNYLVGNWFCDHKKQLNGVHWKKLPPAKRASAIFLRRQPGLSIPKLLKNATYQHHRLIGFLRRVSVKREETGLLRRNWPP